MSKSKVLVIIVTYNGMKWLERCLNSVVNSSIPLDAYIVDNGSTDGSQEFITTNYSQFIFYQSPTNSGFGAANNIGLKYAIGQNYDYVYLLNQDAWVMPNTIETMIATNKKDPQYCVLSPLQTNATMDALDYNFTKCVSKNPILVSDIVFGLKQDVYDIDFVMAAHWLVSRECLLRVGVFSPVFYHYGEDDNYLHRVRYWGYKIGIVPSIMAVHDREFRKKRTKKSDISFLYVLFLKIASNINYSFFYALVKAYIGAIKESISKAKKYNDYTIILAIVPFVFKIGKIYKGRKVSKKTLTT